MIRLILGRLATGIVVVFCVATFAFWVQKAAPGGPFDEERQLDPEVQRNMERAYQLDRPWLVQYWTSIRNLMPYCERCDGWRPFLGISPKQHKPVSEIIAHHFPVSVKLGLMALGFSTLFGIMLGVFAAARQNSMGDHASMSFALIGISMPPFVLGPILIFIFSIQLAWLPPARAEGFVSFILPAMTLGLIYLGVVARLARSGMLETVRQDYIRTARAKGLSERVVIWKHALRLGLMPVVTYLGPATAGLITGSFVVEKIFQIPGLGFYFVESVTLRDWPLLTGLLVVYSIFLVVLNLMVDIAYGLLDPRIRSKR
jgi:oligopeptide transport system permease protein